MGIFSLKGVDDDLPELSNDPTDIVLFMFFGLSLGIVTMQILSRIGDIVPYTVVIFIFGVLISLFNQANDLGMWGDSIEKWSRIDAELMLFVFLPPLIFGEAMSLNWFFVIGGFVQSLILAGPGVLVGAAMMAAITKAILPYNWSWTLSLVFGSILSATDPVAVVALLKDAGASPKLTILIVGESLMNDGTAMVIFTLFFNMLKGRVYNAGDIIQFFFNACIGSPLFGVVCGLIIVRWLRTCNRSLKEIDTTIQIAITICCAYLIFFVAQNPLEVSGVLACCGAGVMVAWLAPPLILSHETMHNVWGMIEWMGNTLIFLLAGLIIGTRTLSSVRRMDWLYVVVLYVLLMVIRFVIIAMFYPWLSQIGHRCTRNEAVFMGWAGLRGALAMALALIVEKERDGEDVEDQSSRLFFYVGGIAALTLLINATTAQWVLHKLKLVEENLEQDIIMTQIRKRLRRKINRVVDQMKTELKPEELEEVRASCSLLRDDIEDYRDTDVSDTSNFNHILAAAAAAFGPSTQHQHDSLLGDDDHDEKASQKSGRSSGRISFSGRPRSRTKSEDVREKRWGTRANSVHQVLTMSRSRDANGAIIKELLAYVRTIFLEIVRVKYWHDIEAGKLPRLSHSAQFLLFSIDVGLDSVNGLTGLQDWDCIERSLNSLPLAIRVLMFVERITPVWFTGVSRLLGRLEARREKRAVYMLTSFIDAHEHAQRKMHSYVGTEEDGDEFPQTPEEIKVKGESIALVQLAKRRLAAMPADTVAAIRSKQAARMLLAKQAELVRNMVQEGLLTPKHAEEVRSISLFASFHMCTVPVYYDCYFMFFF